MAILLRLNPTKTHSSPFAFLRAVASISTVCRSKPSFRLPTQPPPVPKKTPFTVAAHGRQWQDPYHWMSNIQDPDFIEHVKRENSYAEAFMDDMRSVRRSLVEEMTSRMPAKIETPPEHWGPWLYYQFIPEGKEYPILCRRLEPKKAGWIKAVSDFVTGGNKEIVLLDWNELAEKHGYVHVGTCRVSPDHNYLAYTLDTKGDERFALMIKDLRNGAMVSTTGVDGVVSLAWVQDDVNLNLYYTLSDASQRPYRVLCKKLGFHAAADDDDDVYTEADSSFCVDITNTKDGKFVTVNSNSRTSSEVYVIDATNPESGMRRVHKRIPNVQYFLEHHCGYFYVLTNAPFSENFSCDDYHLAICKTEDAESAAWQTIVCPPEGTSIQDMDITTGHLVLFLQKSGLAVTCSINIPINFTNKDRVDIDSLDPWYFPIPGNMCTIVPGANNDYKNPVYRIVLSSPVMPDVVVDYDMSAKELYIIQQDEVLRVPQNSKSARSYLSLIHPSDTRYSEERTQQKNSKHKWGNFSGAYSCDTLDITSHDGVQVPLTILYSNDAWKKDHAPGLLYGYGAYGEAVDKSWCSDRLSLLDRGWVLAFADVRGGGGGDVSWHKFGTGVQKVNSMHDFLSCAEYLLNESYVHREKLSAIGHSAGGLLVASAINMRPDLFGAAILKVPFLDICNTLLDPSLPLTLLDYDEFGNPQIKSEFESILSYAPYENIPLGICYPPVLAVASLHDSRVGVWEAAKWVAKVRDIICPGCSPSIVLKTNMIGGHFSEGGRFAHCEDTADEYAFLMKVIGGSVQIT